MRIVFNTKHIEFYWCNGHYDVRYDEISNNALNFRIGIYSYGSEKGWCKLPRKFKAAVIAAPPLKEEQNKAAVA